MANSFKFKYSSRSRFDFESTYRVTNFSTYKNFFLVYLILTFLNNTSHLQMTYEIDNYKYYKKRFALVKGPKGHKVGKAMLQRNFYITMLYINFLSNKTNQLFMGTLLNSNMQNISKKFSFSSPNFHLVYSAYNLNIKFLF